MKGGLRTEPKHPEALVSLSVFCHTTLTSVPTSTNDPDRP